MQSSHRPPLGVALRWLATTPLRDGAFRGLLFNVAVSVPGRGAQIGLYAAILSALTPRMESPGMARVAAGALSAVLITAVFNPVWVVRTRLQLAPPPRPPLSALMLGVVRGGGHTLWAGAMSTAGARAVEDAVYWGVFEPISAATSAITPAVVPQHLVVGTAAAAAKAAALAVAYPAQVLATRAREEGATRATFAGRVVAIVRTEGVRALYGGLTAAMARGVPHTAVVFATYAATLRAAAGLGLAT